MVLSIGVTKMYKWIIRRINKWLGIKSPSKYYIDKFNGTKHPDDWGY